MWTLYCRVRILSGRIRLQCRACSSHPDAQLCYQTSIADLESKEDFEKLKSDCVAIADAYGARNSKDKVKFYYEKDNDDEKGSSGDADMDAIIAEARSEQKAAKKVASSEEESEEDSEEETEEKKEEE